MIVPFKVKNTNFELNIGTFSEEFVELQFRADVPNKDDMFASNCVADEKISLFAIYRAVLAIVEQRNIKNKILLDFPCPDVTSAWMRFMKRQGYAIELLPDDCQFFVVRD